MKVLMLLLLPALKLLKPCHGETHAHYVNNLTFVNVKLLPLIGNTSASITNIAADRLNNGRLLFSTSRGLFTLSLDTWTYYTIVGQFMLTRNTTHYAEGVGAAAKFDDVTSFVQLSSDEVLLTDHNNDVIRTVDRISQNSSLLAGKATVPQDPAADGSFADCRFKGPFDIVEDTRRPSKFYISERTAMRVRLLDRTNPEGNVTTIHSFAQSATGLHFDGLNNLLYISTSFQIFSYSISNSLLTPVTNVSQQKIPHDDGPILTATFGMLTDITSLNEHTMLACDVGNGRLRIINLASGTVTSICAGSSTSTPVSGKVDQCVIGRPIMAVRINSTQILIGTNNPNNNMAAIEVHEGPPTRVSPTTTAIITTRTSTTAAPTTAAPTTAAPTTAAPSTAAPTTAAFTTAAPTTATTNYSTTNILSTATRTIAGPTTVTKPSSTISILSTAVPTTATPTTAAPTSAASITTTPTTAAPTTATPTAAAPTTATPTTATPSTTAPATTTSSTAVPIATMTIVATATTNTPASLTKRTTKSTRVKPIASSSRKNTQKQATVKKKTTELPLDEDKAQKTQKGKVVNTAIYVVVGILLALAAVGLVVGALIYRKKRNERKISASGQNEEGVEQTSTMKE